MTSATMSGPSPAEKTFTSFTQDQGANYAKNRRGYHANFYKTIIDHHLSTEGQLTSLLDVGCGPGTAARDLAATFAHVIGIDPSEGMITTARTLGGVSSTGDPIRFEISNAEELGSKLEPPIEDASIDLVVAAIAAHWFDMSRFWPQAARVLRPGGSVALWTTGELGMDPSMPNGVTIGKALKEIEERELIPFMEPGNWQSMTLYKDLPLPWTLQPAVEGFTEKSFFRKEWGPENAEEFFQGGGLSVDLNTFEMVLGTMSPVQRWRDAHPDLVGTEGDVVRAMRREVERLMCEVGVEKDKQTVEGRLKGVLLVVKKEIV